MFKIKLVENLDTLWANYKTVSKHEINESVYTGDMAGYFNRGNWQFPYPA